MILEEIRELLKEEEFEDSDGDVVKSELAEKTEWLLGLVDEFLDLGDELTEYYDPKATNWPYDMSDIYERFSKTMQKAKQ